MMIPVKDSLLVPYSTNWNTRITATPTVFSLTAAQATAYTALHTPFIAAYNALMASRADGTQSKNLTAVKDQTKDDLLAYARQLYAFVQANADVSDADKILLGVDPKNYSHKPIPAPTERPSMDIAAVAGRTVTVSIHNGTSTRRRKADGAISAFVYSFVGENYPTDPTLWQFEGAATKSSYDIVLPDSVPNGAQVWVCSAWVSRRGETGPVSVPVTTNIQGGGMSAASKMKIAA